VTGPHLEASLMMSAGVGAWAHRRLAAAYRVRFPDARIRDLLADRGVRESKRESK
jgi:hypothetical protein